MARSYNSRLAKIKKVFGGFLNSAFMSGIQKNHEALVEF